jgi:hypothetical protein
MMAARIPVVLSQAAVAGAQARQLEEDLVAELMVEQGVDISVVPDLTHLRDGSTGLVCLQGIKSDWILLTWLDAESARRALEQRGISGPDWLLSSVHHRDQDLATDNTSPRSSRRRLGILRLNVTRSTDGYLREIRRLRDVNEPSVSVPNELPIIEPPLQIPVARPDGPSDDLDRLLDQLDAFDA